LNSAGFTGREQSALDGFDPDGNFVYILQPPAGVALLDATFHERGFAVVEVRGDSLVYADYRVVNLPEVFR
jgi:hypothetical protein